MTFPLSHPPRPINDRRHEASLTPSILRRGVLHRGAGLPPFRPWPTNPAMAAFPPLHRPARSQAESFSDVPPEKEFAQKRRPRRPASAVGAASTQHFGLARRSGSAQALAEDLRAPSADRPPAGDDAQHKAVLRYAPVTATPAPERALRSATNGHPTPWPQRSVSPSRTRTSGGAVRQRAAAAMNAGPRRRDLWRCSTSMVALSRCSLRQHGAWRRRPACRMRWHWGHRCRPDAALPCPRFRGAV